MMEFNLFNYATSELSQDAFLCWLFSSINYVGDDNDFLKVKECAKNILKDMINTNEDINVKRTTPLDLAIDVINTYNAKNNILEPVTFINGDTGSIFIEES